MFGISLFKKKTGIEEAIKHYFEAIRTVPNINSGGCLSGAYAIYLKIKKEGYDVKDVAIIQLSSKDERIKANKKFLNNTSKNAYSDNHFGLTMDGGKTIYDSDGEINMFWINYKLLIPSKDVRRFVGGALRGEGWNDTFNRIEGTKEINKRLNIKMGYYNK